MIVTTSGQIDGQKTVSYIDIVTGTEIYLAGGVFGGGAITQEKLFGAQAFPLAKDRMIEKAKALNADAIIGVNVQVAALGTNSIFVIVSGTAVKLDDNNADELPEL